MTLKLLTVAASNLTGAQTDEIVELCGSVFSCDYRSLLDLCPVRTHVLRYEDGRLASHALWLDRPLRMGDGPWRNAAYIEGVATHPDYRRRGYGAAVMNRVQKGIAEYDFGALSPAVEPWYAALGWERWRGPLFIEQEGRVVETPGETVLIYRTSHTGALDLNASLTALWRPFEVW